MMDRRSAVVRRDSARMGEIVMPQLGESVTEGTITKWFKQVGDHVTEDETLFEVSTDKVDSEVPSPATGYVSEIRVPEGETVDVGTVLVVLSDEAGGAGAPAPADAAEAPAADAPAAAAPPVAATPVAADTAPAPVPAAPVDQGSAPAPAPPPAPAAPAPAADDGGPRLLSPLVRRLIEENALDVATIAGTGLGGRITREDVLAHLDAVAAQPAVAAPAPMPAPPMPAPPTQTPAPPTPAVPAPAPVAPVAPFIETAAASHTSGDSVVALSNIRRRTGEHMVMSLATSPHAITVTEVDYEGVERVRKPARDQFKAEEGFSLTYLPFVSRAVIDALESFPHLNATVGDGELIVHNAVNLSIAVDLGFEGLLAPVVKGAEGKRLRAIAREIHDLATRARTKKLSPDDLDAGTFTISNSGSFGTFVVAPIINQPQVAILSTDGVTRRPVVVELPDGSESIAIHSVGNLTMSWDHRAFDGAYAAAFLAEVKDIIETRDWSAEL